MSENYFTQAEFNQYLGEHKLMGAHCPSCDVTYLPPRAMCPVCFGDAMEWTEVSDSGELTAFTVIHIAPTAMIAAGYGRDNPYVSGIVRLENGLSISAQILGLDPAKPEEIKIGTPVKAEFVDRGEGDEQETFLAFRVVG